MAAGLQPFSDLPGLELLQPNGCLTAEALRGMLSFLYDQVVVACNLAGGDQIEDIRELLETMQGQLDAIDAKCSAVEASVEEIMEKCDDLVERVEELENP